MRPTMKSWIKTKDRWPKPNDEVLINRVDWKEPRPAKLWVGAPLAHFRLTDCTHPLQNSCVEIEGTEWLDA